MNRLFDRFAGGWDLGRFGGGLPYAGAFAPNVDVNEDDKQIRVQAELPGLDENDIELSLHDNVLTIEGEKKEEREETNEGRTYSECRYGHFRREIPLSAEVETDKVDATFKKGVLTVTLLKTPQAQAERKRIEVKSTA
jgi:HSP20 family protein